MESHLSDYLTWYKIGYHHTNVFIWWLMDKVVTDNLFVNIVNMFISIT